MRRGGVRGLGFCHLVSSGFFATRLIDTGRKRACEQVPTTHAALEAATPQLVGTEAPEGTEAPVAELARLLSGHWHPAAATLPPPPLLAGPSREVRGSALALRVSTIKLIRGFRDAMYH
jgi:hypothetical protein